MVFLSMNNFIINVRFFVPINNSAYSLPSTKIGFMMFLINFSYTVKVSSYSKTLWLSVEKMEPVSLPHSDIWATMISSISITLRMGLHVQNHTLLHHILMRWQLCEHIVYKGVRTSLGTTNGLQSAWTTPSQNKGTAGILTALWIFYHLPESHMNMPGLDWLQDTVLM